MGQLIFLKKLSNCLIEWSLSFIVGGQIGEKNHVRDYERNNFVTERKVREERGSDHPRKEEDLLLFVILFFVFFNTLQLGVQCALLNGLFCSRVVLS